MWGTKYVANLTTSCITVATLNTSICIRRGGEGRKKEVTKKNKRRLPVVENNGARLKTGSIKIRGISRLREMDSPSKSYHRACTTY